MGEGGYETHGESGGHDRSGIHNPSVEEMGRRKGGRTRKERKRTKTSYRRLNCLHAYTACRKATAARGGQGRVVSGKGQILTTYRGPSSREREGRGGTRPGKRVFLFDNHSFQLAYNPTHLISLQYITYTHIN